MRFPTILLLAVPLLSFAQAPAPAPPPEVDRALRTQATAFLKYESEGNFRKAYELVSEDSKDYYLGAVKEKPSSVDIQKIEYSDNFTKAVVSSASKQIVMMLGRAIEIPSGINARWRLEDGQWKWYHDPSQDVIVGILGSSPAPSQGSPAAATTPKLPDFSPKGVADLAAKLPTPKATVNRRSLPFTVGRESTEEVVFHNSAPGQVRVDADMILDYPGFTVEPQSVLLNPEEDATFKVTYHPNDRGVFNAILRLTLEPFRTEFKIQLKLARDTAAPKP